jgi:hypothetical protein
MRLVHLRGGELSPYQAGLRRLEAGVSYPLDHDRFRIDHGERYAAFFERMGEAHFLLALDGDEVVGTFGGVGKWAQSGERRVPSVYGADWKIAPAWRGGRLAPKFMWTGIRNAWSRDVPSWRLAYVAAMRGSRGDVMRSAPRWSPMRLASPAARLAVYFTPRAALSLDPTGCPTIAAGGLDLSPDLTEVVTSTAGAKDLILESTGQPWPLWHLPLGPRAWTPSFAHYLRSAAERLPAGATACFALDQRLSAVIDWLAARGISAGATCTVYMFRLPFSPRPEPWVHLATSEI